MDAMRARALLDLLLGKDSRPRQATQMEAGMAVRRAGPEPGRPPRRHRPGSPGGPT